MGEASDVRPMQEPIAIVGSACRFPGGASSPSKLWGLLKEPRDVVQEVPPSRFDSKAFYHPDPLYHGSTNAKHAYLLQDDPRAFDRDFFNISPKEAEAMDPQQRCLLEIVYEGVEAAGYSMPQLRGSSTGVFVGAMSFDYQYIAMRGVDSLPQYHATGASTAILANRVSYFYDWRGASMTLDTACSSSLVALHQAVMSLRSGQVDMAIAAGTNLILGPEPYIAESMLNMLSPNGRSYMWDSSADGYTRGEGFAAVVLKTLSQALADGDHIECVIRETGVNSDGRTPGITMPSASAQTKLIRDTYAKAGLDPVRDRPQFFEAHGTGTPAGDPIEARAIHDAFFPDSKSSADDQKLWVGSIKTVLGHTEGTAGLAGVLKASLAVQNGHIPANLHFRDLNPKIRPFANELRVPTSLIPWPALSNGQPRRVSVNSFGFGGTNAHAIIESYDGENAEDDKVSKANQAGLVVLSANSAQALSAEAARLAGYVLEHGDIPLGRLSRTLFQRADFPFRSAFSATSTVQLADKLDGATESLKNTPRTAAIPDALPPRILGVFTGQGAQWPTMGIQLYKTSTVFRQTLDRLQESLDTLPAGDRPDWKIINELSAPKECSRIGLAAFSQPLCTALQVALVDTLHAAEVKFAAVVGHSSGEIGAAYAAGYLSAGDAIRAAYYRGFHSHLAQGTGGKLGKMMAVGMSLEQATESCKEIGAEKLKVAASNSPTSCTLAGDEDVIEDAKKLLDEKGTFARLLAVDKAYHSHHMLPCAEPYLASLRKCGVSVRDGSRECRWYSSVWGANGRSRSWEDEREALAGQYWVDNLTNTVQFSQAVSRAVSEEPYVLDLALEVGPHPALKGPASEVIKSFTGVKLPYGSVCKRGEGAVEAFLDGLGLLWTSFPMQRPMITFDSIHAAFSEGISKDVAILKGLPPYPFDHNGLIWRESRASHKFRTQQHQSRHELLGFPAVLGEQDKREVHWHQVLKPRELPWVRGHTIQGEVLFPATAYLTMAYEAAVRLADDQKSLHLVELHNVEIVRAMSLQEDSPGLEVVFTIKVTSQSTSCITAEVACYSGDVNVSKLDGPVAGLTNHFSASVRILLGPPHKRALPSRTKPLLPMDTLNMEQFYTSLNKVGYNYSGHFKSGSVDRHLHHAVVSMPDLPQPSTISRASLHPAALDTAIQGILAGFSYPEDGRLKTVYLPTGVDCVRITMSSSAASSSLKSDSYLTFADAKALTGDVDLFNATDDTVEVQMRGVQWTALEPALERWVYAGETWLRDPAFGIEPGLKTKLTPKEDDLRILLIRVAHFWLRRLKNMIKPLELMLMGKHRKHMMKWVRDHLFPIIDAGKHPDIPLEWAKDTLEDVQKWSAPYVVAGNNDIRILNAVGENLPAIARGTMPALQVMLKDGMLDKLYMEGVGFTDGNIDFETLVKQLAHRYPRMKVLEIGAGTGGTTKAVFSGLGDQYTSYTYTDISAGFFEQAKAKFSQHANRMVFKTLNIEKDPEEQGFEPGSYDFILASNCLHATSRLEETMTNARRLLRPGGYLMLLEITRDHLPIQLLMGTLPGWFLGIEDGRVWAPTIDLNQWDSLLKKTGFSGVDTSSTPSYCSVIMSQAVHETVQTLRDPLAAAASNPAALSKLDRVLVIGDSELASTSRTLLAGVGGASVSQHGDFEGVGVPYGAAVLCLADLEEPVFGSMSKERFDAMQNVFRNAGTVLWVTSGAASGKQPLANITVGLGRTLLAERSELKLQFLDVDNPESLEASTAANLLLRLTVSPSSSDDILWTHEPHLAVKNGAFYVPRVLPLDFINQRSLARIRKVTKSTSLESPTAAIELSKRDSALELLHHAVSKPVKAGEVLLKVTASSLHPLFSDMYVCIGRDAASGDKIIGLSSTNSSAITINETSVVYRMSSKVPESEDGSKDAARLRYFATQAMATQLLGNAKSPIWVHGASNHLSQAIAHIADEQDIKVYQTTSNSTSANDDEQIFIHPYSSERDVRSLRPKGVETLIDLEASQNKTFSALLSASLPKSAMVDCQVEDDLTIALDRVVLSKLAAKTFTVPDEEDEEDLDHSEYDDHDENDAEIRSLGLSNGILPISRVSETTGTGMGSSVVVDWSSAHEVSTSVPPLDHGDLFSAHRTYLLFGMTGDVGISVARWMVDNGAQHVVLASRNPSVPAGVFEFFSQEGARLRTMKVDVTDREALQAAIDNIKIALPPIGGVINGAMVLRDRLFVDISWDDFNATLAPKVLGTRNLDEVFADRNELDFFIVLSSATSFVGILGQSAYSAANHYMASLVRQRRARGLPGSSVVIGFLTGLGYIFRSEREHLAAIEKSLLPRLERQAETDLHELLAEAIVCGRPDSEQPAELITGVRTTFTEPWHEDPRLSCYLAQEGAGDDSDEVAEDGANVKVDAQLAAASAEEAQGVLEKCFAKALGNMLQLDPEKIAGDAPVSDLGVDSLVSVRVREWFLKELGVEVPILKIMAAGQSIARLCEDALAGWRKLQGGASAKDAGADKKVSQGPEMDWTKELNRLLEGINPHVPPGIVKSREPPRTQNRRVVLTGCTGFLGTHMIRSLVADPDIAEVHCLCIRSRGVRVQDDKIREYKGDLSKPLLGLFIDDFVMLAETADLIIHVGAEVNHLKSYEAVRTPNVISTQILLAMARPRGVPVHFISSSSVAMLQKDSNELPEIPPSGISPPTDAESLMGNAIGYAASKWMGELLLEHAAKSEQGPPTVVHRFPNIMGPDAPDEIPLVALDRYCTKMRAVPALDPKKWIGHLDILDVSDVVPDFVANAFAFGGGGAKQEDFAVHHYCSANRFLLSDLAGMYQAKLGGPVEAWPTAEWMRRARAMGMPKGVEVTFTGHDEVFVSPVLRKGPPSK
ncbi:probable polyketide synthase [Lecanosticta acicola]|uniref:Probable polyketide synthase n=1 Tax=Lecanosticta acicola TaxID=111012 RepID=A0AAI8W1C8_9PEZI|nr:probable polyketide synthase [Lecanosticta acicola]